MPSAAATKPAAAKPAPIIIRPQPGPQERFLSSNADIAIFGGSAGSGKTWSLLLETLRHKDNPAFGAVVFRRTYPQITNEGALWDESANLYPLLQAKPNIGNLFWRFPSGAKVTFSHLQHDSNLYDYQGAQIASLNFDELTHFSERQFFYLLSRNRSTSGVRPYVRATCNPDADSWVAAFLAWWIDQDTGFPIPERSGKVRWFIRQEEQLVWADSPAELRARFDGMDVQPKSVTFVPAKLSDNQILMRADPGYLANLLALPLVERERLLGGNWKIRASGGTVFQRQWFRVVAAAPAGLDWVRFWDLAATAVKAGNDPDWLAGAKVAVDDDGRIWIADLRSMRGTPGEVEDMLKQTAILDGREVDIYFEQEPGSSGKALIDQYRRRVLAGYTVQVLVAAQRGSKLALAGPLSAQAEARNVYLVNGPWAPRFLDEAEAFPDGAHDDQVDAASSGYLVVSGSAWREKRGKRRVTAGATQQMMGRAPECPGCKQPVLLPPGADRALCPRCGTEVVRA